MTIQLSGPEPLQAVRILLLRSTCAPHPHGKARAAPLDHRLDRVRGPSNTASTAPSSRLRTQPDDAARLGFLAAWSRGRRRPARRPHWTLARRTTSPMSVRARRARPAPGTRTRSRPPAARSLARRCRTAATPRPRRSRRSACPPASGSARAPRAAAAPRPPACRSPGANAGSITSMSKLKNAGASPTRVAHAPRVVGRRHRPQLVAGDHVEAHLARLAEVGGASRAARACRPAPSARARAAPPRPPAGTACRGSSARRSTGPRCRRGRRAARARAGRAAAACARSSPSTIEWSPPSTIGTTPAASQRRRGRRRSARRSARRCRASRRGRPSRRTDSAANTSTSSAGW